MAGKWTFGRAFRTAWLIGGLAFMAWLFYSYQSHGVDDTLLKDSDATRVLHCNDYILFSPVDTSGWVLFFYPGALVDPFAYVPLCRKAADQGIAVYLLKMPWRLAKNGYLKPKELRLLEDSTKTYILAGHSQGGKMAAQFVHENPGLIDKLILIGSTHPRDFSLADSSIPIMKIFGSCDGVANEAAVLENRTNLPSSTEFVRIVGANHSQFGYYGFQLGDNRATISREQQQREVLDKVLEFITSGASNASVFKGHPDK